MLVAPLVVFATLAVAQGGDPMAMAVDQIELPPWLQAEEALPANNSQNAKPPTKPASNANANKPELLDISTQKLPVDNKNAKVAFSTVVVNPDPRDHAQRQSVRVKNIGKAPISIDGWTLSDGKGNNYTFTKTACGSKTTIPEGGAVTFLTAHYEGKAPCVLNFTLATDTKLSLYDASRDTLKVRER